ncbi:MAG: hypothetical protein HOO89_06060 [Ferruginibacter sp.]|nr:hypothetical protein [Ferruginibacter sp.]
MNYKLLDFFRSNYFRLIRRKPNFKRFRSKINDINASDDFIGAAIASGKPFMIAKLGESELEVLRNYFAIERNKKKSKFFLFFDYLKYGEKNIWTGFNTIVNDSGFFPKNENLLFKISEIYVNGIKNIDYFGTAQGLDGWYNNRGEDFVINKLNPFVNIITVSALDALAYNKITWPSYLKNKKVLVIHPFQKSIESNYENHDKVFPKEFLPSFNLKTLKSVQSIGFNETGFNDWFEALKDMELKIDNIDFDIALIGCGAYGLPLASFIKNKGKQAIHVGGALQLYFGILGKRWDNHPVIKDIKNKYWIRPDDTEIPISFEIVGNGSKSYW